MRAVARPSSRGRGRGQSRALERVARRAFAGADRHDRARRLAGMAERRHRRRRSLFARAAGANRRNSARLRRGPRASRAHRRFRRAADPAPATTASSARRRRRGFGPWRSRILTAASSRDASGGAALGSDTLLRAPDGSFEIVLSRVPQAGNWISTKDAARFRVVVRLYDTTARTGTELTTLFMPRIARDHCA